MGDIKIFARDTLVGVSLEEDGSSFSFDAIPERPTTFYIVSGIVGRHLQERSDILIPMNDLNDDPIRNDNGHIVAVRGLKRP